MNAGYVWLPDVPPANAVPDRGKVSFRTTTRSISDESAVRIVFGRLRPLTVTVDWSIKQETGVWWYSDIVQPQIRPDESSAETARRAIEKLKGR